MLLYCSLLHSHALKKESTILEKVFFFIFELNSQLNIHLPSVPLQKLRPAWTGIAKAMTLTTGLAYQKRNMAESVIFYKSKQFTSPFRKRQGAIIDGDVIDILSLYSMEVDLVSFS